MPFSSIAWELVDDMLEFAKRFHFIVNGVDAGYKAFTRMVISWLRIFSRYPLWESAFSKNDDLLEALDSFIV
jgi:hypothetical protein